MIVAVPLDAPRLSADAAPPIFRVVALVLNRLAVVAVVVNEPPLIAALPAAVKPPSVVISPFEATVNLVAPPDEAVRRSEELRLLMISAALPPYPPCICATAIGELVPTPSIPLGTESTLLLTVVVPDPAPILTVDAAPPIFRVVAFELNRLAVVAVVVKDPPFTATFPEVVILPLEPVIVKLVPTTLFVPRAMAVAILAPDKSIPVVNPPPPDEVILRPVGTVCVADWLSINTSWLGLVPVVPAALTNALYPVDPSAVVTTKLELVAVAARVNAISLELLVVIVLPLLYAFCRVIVCPEQVITLFDPLRHKGVPDESASPVTVR